MSISKLNYNEKQCAHSAQKGAQFLGFYLLFLDLTYPYYKVSEERERVKG
jgi:hypothetical protein